jgi:hypothetical protein
MAQIALPALAPARLTRASEAYPWPRGGDWRRQRPFKNNRDAGIPGTATGDMQ